ncbi:hypothetical protein KM043_009119 [Ampulex compressa]|nr:hypothetical protein KM043_009119 [Ampulex compressa]
MSLNRLWQQIHQVFLHNQKTKLPLAKVSPSVRAKSSVPGKLLDMVETSGLTQATDGQTQFGNGRRLEPSECIFVFKDTQSDYEEPPSDEEVSFKSFAAAVVLRIRGEFSKKTTIECPFVWEFISQRYSESLC